MQTNPVVEQKKKTLNGPGVRWIILQMILSRKPALTMDNKDTK